MQTVCANLRQLLILQRYKKVYTSQMCFPQHLARRLHWRLTTANKCVYAQGCHARNTWNQLVLYALMFATPKIKWAHPCIIFLFGHSDLLYCTTCTCTLVSSPSVRMQSAIVFRPVHLRRNVGFWTVITVPTIIIPNSTVQVTVSHNYGVRPYKDNATVQYDFDHNLAVGFNFGPKQIVFE